MNSENCTSEPMPSQAIQEELGLLRASLPTKTFDNLASLCHALGTALDAGLPLRPLGSCAAISKEGALRLTSQQQQRRVGPYPFFTRGLAYTGIDDFTCDDPALLVGSKGAVARGSGKLLVIEPKGKYSFSDNYLKVTADSADRAYLREVLNTLDALRYAQGSHAARVIEEAALKAAFIPWPPKTVRDQFVSALEQCDRIGAAPLKSAILHAWHNATHNVQFLEKPSVKSEAPPALPERLSLGEGFFELADKLIGQLAKPTDEILDVVAATGNLAAPTASAQSSFCICFPPFEDEPWTTESVDPCDSRWLYGPPPKNKPHFAWVQQTIACMNHDGRALLLMRNAVLHSTLGRERPIREAWAASNMVEAVIALPGGIFPDGRPPASLIVLNKSRHSHSETLFINALNDGVPIGKFPDGALARQLPEDAVERIVDTYRRWLEDADYLDQPGFCHAASQAEIGRREGNLSPWLYTGAPADDAAQQA